MQRKLKAKKLRIKRGRRLLPVMLSVILLALFALSGCGSSDSGEITSIEQLKEPGRKIGVSAETSDDRFVKEVFPQAEIEYYKEEISGYTSVSQGKLDAFVFGKLTMEFAIYNGLEGVRLLDDSIGEGYTCGVGLSPKAKIPDLEDKVNAFLDEVKADGTLDDMMKRWLEQHDETMPSIPVPETSSLHLTVGTTGSYMPFSYYKGTELAGYDIELAYRFAAWLGATIEFKVYDYGGIIAAAQAGDIDCIFAGLFMTPERKEALAFSQPTYIDEIKVMVRDTGSSAGASQGITGFSDLKNARIGVMTGSVQTMQAEEHFPDAELYYFNTDTDMLNAMRSGKIDAFASAEAMVKFMMAENRDLTYLDEWLSDGMQVAAAFPKTDSGRALCDEFNEFIQEIHQNGVYDEIQSTWFGEDESKRVVPDLYTLSSEKGTLRMAADTSFVPFVYIKDGNPVGIDVDTAVRFCKEYGYGLEIVPMDFSGIIPSLASGKVDFACSCIAVTPERAESVNFSDPLSESHSVVAVLKSENAQAKGGAFWSSVAESFERTFIREGRWKLFVSGIGTTLLITVLSIILGTALGFAVFMLCRNGNPVANKISDFCIWLVRGLPAVVLLMILYYIIFVNMTISGTAVSVIGFTLVFGAGVFGMIKSGVGAIDRGQLEAAYALGYTNRRAFFRIILPQAMPHFMPAYKASITEIIKATAIVGYVAVQDLTKMGDIVRSRTYEAFFPLIAVAVIYFVLAAVLTFVVNRIELRLDPKLRTPEKIRKEVEGK